MYELLSESAADEASRRGDMSTAMISASGYSMAALIALVPRVSNKTLCKIPSDHAPVPVLERPVRVSILSQCVALNIL